MTERPEPLVVRLHAIEYLAPDISQFEFRAPDGGMLPPFAAGAHIDLQLTPNLLRSYSLINAPNEQDRYVIAVKREVTGRGGSLYMHHDLRVGAKPTMHAPVSSFALDERADLTIFVAGGIGITPFLSMIERLNELGRSWRLHYSVREPDEIPFSRRLERLRVRGLGELHLVSSKSQRLDVAAVVAAALPDAHLYCCGPTSMIETFEVAAQRRDPDTVHVEYFSPKAAPTRTGGFTVEATRSGVLVEVPDGTTILDALLNAGLRPPYSCMEGICSTCETRVLEGTPDHHDSVLSRAQQEANRTMMICCSGSKSAKLVLDL